MGFLRRSRARAVPLAAAPLLLAAVVAPVPPAAAARFAGAARAPARSGRVAESAACPARSDLLAHSPVARWRAAGGVTGASWNGTDGFGHPVRLTVAQAPTTRVRLGVSSVATYGDVRGTTELTAATPGAVVGVNGDYFAYDWSGSAVPYGPLVRGGRALRVPPGRSPVVGADAAGRPVAGRARVVGSVQLPGGRLAVGSVNDDGGSDRADPVASGTAVAVVTPWLGRARPRRDWEVVVRAGAVVTAARHVSFGSGASWGSGDAGRGDVLLAASGAAARRLRAAAVGARATLGYDVRTDDGTRLREAVGSGSVMLHRGRDLATCDGSGDISRPRTLVAWDAPRARLWLVTVDGRGTAAPVSRYGLTYRQVTEVARALGASEAVMVDGGGSTTMALRVGGAVRRVDAPADAPQRAVPDGLVLVPR